MKIYTEYKKAKVIDFCIIQIEETKEIIEVESFKDIHWYIDEDIHEIIINEDIGIMLDGENRDILLEDLGK